MRLAQGLGTTPFPLPAVSPQTFVALPVAWVDADYSMSGGKRGDKFGELFYKLLFPHHIFYRLGGIPAQAGIQHPLM